VGEFTAKVQKAGRVTIPKNDRDAEGIRDGDLVRVTVKKLKVS
jgi:AbrB family looped-hinge helix DNA binding protein